MPSSGTDRPGLRRERRGGTLILTIDRPHAGNSLDEATILGLRFHLGAAASETDLRCVVLAGAGRFFCAGGDLKAYRAIDDRAALERIFGSARALLRDVEALPVPVIAAIDGFALGGGAELALACDLRIAGAGAGIGFPQLRLGIITGWDGAERLVRLVGRGVAMRLLLTGEHLSADEAHASGVVELVAEDALSAALDLAAGLEDAAPLAVRAAKRAIAAPQPLHPEVGRQADELFADLWFTEDHREAERAFAEKRRPSFHGR